MAIGMPPPMRLQRRSRSVTRGIGASWPSLVSVGLALVLWHVLAITVGKGGLLLPSPVQVVTALVDDSRIITKALGSTLSTAVIGLGIGALVAALLAAPTVLFPATRRPLVRQMTIFYCLPLVTIAPLLYLIASGRVPQIIMAASSVLFPIFIALVQGFATPHVMWRDVVDSLGGSRWTYFTKVQVPGATRELLTAARIGGPAAVLGATLAEYFGGTSGLGAVMINSLAQLNAPRAYALGAVITLVSSGAFLLVGAIGRFFFPWTQEMTSDH